MTLYRIEIAWANGSPPTTVLVSDEDLDGSTFAEWRDDLIPRISTRPIWVRLGELIFHTQGVRSIELIETIEKED